MGKIDSRMVMAVLWMIAQARAKAMEIDTTLRLSGPMHPGRVRRLKDWGLAECHQEARQARGMRLEVKAWPDGPMAGQVIVWAMNEPSEPV